MYNLKLTIDEASWLLTLVDLSIQHGFIPPEEKEKAQAMLKNISKQLTGKSVKNSVIKMNLN